MGVGKKKGAIRGVAFGIFQLFKAAPKDLCLLLTIILLQALVSPCFLIAIQKVVNWISVIGKDANPFPLIWMTLWGLLLLLDLFLNPITSLLRITVNEKLVAHCNLMLMRKTDSIYGIAPFENTELYDQIQFLKDESSRRPVNFVFVVAGLVRDGISLIALALILSQLGFYIPLLVFLSCIPHAFSTFKFEKETWDQAFLQSPESRRLSWLSSLMVDEKPSKEMRLFRFGSYIIASYEKVASSYLKKILRNRWKETGKCMLLSSLTVIGQTVTLTLVIVQAKNGLILSGAVVMLFQALFMCQSKFNEFTSGIGFSIPAFLYFTKLRTFLDSNLDNISSGKKKYKLIPAEIEVRFENVSFFYPDGRKGLSKINCTFPPLSKIAIVGENGSGKSTLVKLLTRLYDPTEGRILINGIDLKEIDIDAWRESLSVVLQDFGQYHFTASKNISLGGNFTTSDIAGAAKKGGFDRVASKLPNGLCSLLGKEFGGTTLSGGEWQKLAMSRALLRKASVLILDEPNAALDVRSEYGIFKKYAEHAKNKMSFFITHRIGSIKEADWIVVLKNGEILEQGTHEQLIELGREYSFLFSFQTSQPTTNTELKVH